MPDEIGGVDSQALAAAAASAAVNATPDVEPEPETLLEQLQEGEEYYEDSESVPPPQPRAPAPRAIPEPVYDELGMELARMGLDLGVDRSELSPELQPMYDRFAQQAIVHAQQYQGQVQQLAEAQAEIQQFAQKLQDDPQKVLLTMAVTNPEAFQQTVEAYERMSEDEFYRNTVIRDLQAEAKLAAAERQQQLFYHQQKQQKVSQVIKATHVAADAYGIDHNLAEELVAAAITRGGGDIELSQIAGVLSKWAPSNRSVSPQVKAQRVAQAPPPSVQGAGTPVRGEAQEDDISPGLSRANRNPYMDLVRAASKRISRSE